MADSSQGVSKQTLIISIAASLLIGFLSGIIFSDKQGPGPASTQVATPQQAPDNSQAIASLEFETAQNPDNGQAWTRLGHAYFDSEQFAKAIMAYNKSLEFIPGATNVMTDLGVMYRRNNQPEKAIETFIKVLEIDPRFEQALFNSGVVYFYDIKNYDLAFNSWKTLVQINPNATTPSGSLVSDLITQLQNQVK